MARMSSALVGTGAKTFIRLPHLSIFCDKYIITKQTDDAPDLTAHELALVAASQDRSVFMAPPLE
jgi:hypothetical protein